MISRILSRWLPERQLRLYIFGAALAIPILLPLQFESHRRQREAIGELTAANLRLSGGRLVEEIERIYRAEAENFLRSSRLMAAGTNGLQASDTGNMQRVIQQELLNQRNHVFEHVFVVGLDRLLFRPTVPPSPGTADLLQRNIHLLSSEQPGKVLPLALTGPPAEQFFYVEIAAGAYVVISVDPASGPRIAEDARFILGIPSRIRLVSVFGYSPDDGDILVPFPSLFPFWQLAVSRAAGQPGEGRMSIAIFSAVTIVTLFLLGCSLLLIGWHWDLVRERDAFVKSVAHDLRDSLQKILTFSETLVRGAVPPNQIEEFHGIILKEAQSLSQFRDNILDLSSLRQGAKQPHFTPCDLRRIVAETVAATESQIRPQGFQIELSMPESLPQVRCDPDAIKGVLANLLDNAVKFSGVSRRIQVSVMQRDQGTDQSVVVAVRDYGIGIAPTDRDRIFEEFFRAQNGGIKGHGLGLSLAKARMAAHRGKIAVDSELGRGSEFRLVFRA